MGLIQRNLEQLPVFVYGTLRQNMGNYEWVLRGNTEQERNAILDGYMLVGRGVPFALPQEGSCVVGEVMDVRAEVWRRVLCDLDTLEGYRGRSDDPYSRVVRDVRCEDGTVVSCYVYVGGAEWARETNFKIPGGDWVAYARSRRG